MTAIICVIITTIIIIIIIIIVMLPCRQGYGDCPQDWEDFRKEVTRRPEFRFDFFFKSRSALDLQRRSDFLVRNTEKDNARSRELKKMAADLALKEERARKRALKKELKMEKEKEQQELVQNGDEQSQDIITSDSNDGALPSGTMPNLTASSSSTALQSASTIKPASAVPANGTQKNLKLVLKVNKKKRDRRPTMADAVDGARTYKKKQRTSRGGNARAETSDGVSLVEGIGGEVMGARAQETVEPHSHSAYDDGTAIVFASPST